MTKLLRTCVKVSSGPAVLGAVAVMFFACQVRGQDTVQLSTNYYVVSGATLGEMRQSMRQSRPWKGQSPLEGMTDWRITWQFNLTPAGDGCRCSSFITKTSIATTLPAWMAPTNATPAVRTVWQRYITALRKHEDGHAQLALAAAAEIRQRVGEVGEGLDCESLKRKLNEIAYRALEEHRQKERDYDRRTRHGAAQGAALPGRIR
jgi:predicted secreted Zn-dependent protease